MKFVMYHYVRSDSGEFPYFRALHVDDFRRQLDHFEEAHGFVGQQAFLETVRGERVADEGVVLTFDDGLADHFDFVFPELVRRGLWGIFYVPTGMFANRKLLDVHRIHCLLGRFGGAKLIDEVKGLIRTEMLSHAHVDAFRRATYARQQNDAATIEFKRILNYYVSYEYRESLLDQLMNRFFNEEELFERYYLTFQELSEMQAAGMLIGGHSVSHPVMSKLEEAEQQREIRECFEYLESASGGLRVRTFCYPYGGFHSFTSATEELLTANGIQFTLNVEPRDATTEDFRTRPQALPRFDCNSFPYGKCRALPEC